jgi:hypothetical protein
MVASGVLGDDFALECGERVGEQWLAAVPELPVDPGEAVLPSMRSRRVGCGPPATLIACWDIVLRQETVAGI